MAKTVKIVILKLLERKSPEMAKTLNKSYPKILPNPFLFTRFAPINETRVSKFYYHENKQRLSGPRTNKMRTKNNC